MNSNLLESIYEDIVKAGEVLRGVVHTTPLDYSATFSRLTGADVYLKLENLQKTGSFKVRGAYYKIWNLSDEEKRKGVVAASAGNHAQGVAYAASRQGVSAKIVMPISAPLAKIEATRNYGAEVVLHGRVYDEAYQKAIEIAEAEGRVFVHPFDDAKVIAGQGTIALEILKQMNQPPDVVVVPVGGGGLISGIAVGLRRHLGSNIKIIGVEPSYADKMKKSIEKGRPVQVEARPGLMDGLVTKKPGELTYKLVSELVDDIVTVTDSEVAHTIFMLLERSKILAEGAGAAALAAIIGGKIDVSGKRVVAIISGGNMDLTRLTTLVERELVRANRIVRIRGAVPDQPGQLNRVLEVLAKARFNIIDIRHDRLVPFLDPGWAAIEVIAEAPSEELVDEIIAELNAMGLPFGRVRV